MDGAFQDLNAETTQAEVYKALTHCSYLSYHFRWKSLVETSISW